MDRKVLLILEDPPGEIRREVNIKDLAPTAAKLLGAEPAAEWEGTALL